MPIFAVTSEQVQRLDEHQVVDVLRRLVRAELQSNGIKLRSGSVPAEIHIPDGGEDGRVSWTGGPNQTDFIPSRYTIFQCKKGKPTKPSVKKETWTKSSSSAAPQLSDALTDALARSGAYVVVTPHAIVRQRVDDLVKSIEEGIEETGRDPQHLSETAIYGSNELAEWIKSHPQVALHVNAELREVNLSGLRDFDTWSKEPTISGVPFQGEDDPRFNLRGVLLLDLKKENPAVAEPLTLGGVRSTLAALLPQHRVSLRVTGPSGYGKTRFVHQLFHGAPEDDDVFDPRALVFCDHAEVSDRVISVARDLAASGSRCFLIVDDCPDGVHNRLVEEADVADSNCVIITASVESKSHGRGNTLRVDLGSASDDLIDGITKVIAGEDGRLEDRLIRQLAEGFPRMAALAARAALEGDKAHLSVEEILERILWGDTPPSDETLNALRLLSLFSVVGVENEAAQELELLASFEERSVTPFYRDLMKFKERGVVPRIGDFIELQPIPLAVRLADAWIKQNPPGSPERLFEHVSPDMRLRLLKRLGWLSFSEEIQEFGRALLDKVLTSDDVLDTDYGGELLDRLVHLNPDATMAHLDRLLGGKSVDALKSFDRGRRMTVWALEKLVFRAETFEPAARLLLKLGAAETEKWSNNATGQFAGLYKVYLSGTEAAPENRLSVLDEGLLSEDERIRKICLKALGQMLETSHFSRSGGHERIGAEQPLKDWSPTIYGEIYDFHKAAVSRLRSIALSNDPIAEEARDTIGAHIHGLLDMPAVFPELGETIRALKEKKPDWYHANRAVNQWLYFDAHKAPEDYVKEIRQFYDEIFLEDVVDQIIMYSRGWNADFHDPDTRAKDEDGYDHDYAERKIKQLIEGFPRTASSFESILSDFAMGEHHGAASTLSTIIQHVSDPGRLFTLLLAKVCQSGRPLKGEWLIRIALAELDARDRSLARRCLEKAAKVPEFQPSLGDLIGALKLDDELVRLLKDRILDDTIQINRTNFVRLSKQMDDLVPAVISELVDVLLQKGFDGAWAAVEFLMFHFYDQPLERDERLEAAKRACMNMELFTGRMQRQSDGHEWETLVFKLMDGGFCDDGDLRTLIRTIFSIAYQPDFSVQLDYDDVARRVLRRIATECPAMLWDEFRTAYEAQDEKNRSYLDNLVNKTYGGGRDAGILASLPMSLFGPWMLEDREARLRLVMGWLTMVEIGENQKQVLTQEFIEFLDEYIEDKDEMDIVLSRLLTGISSGPYSLKLNEDTDLLRPLSESKNPVVRRWATQTVHALELDAKDRERSEANRDAGFRT